MLTAGDTTRVPLTLSRSALRIVLFGLPAAGKSSLLGALARAARLQDTADSLLGGSLVDSSGDLQVLERQVYEEGPRQTLAEVAPFPIAIGPLAPGARPVRAVLIDCDGRVASRLLQASLAEDPEGGGRLARAVLHADALILVLDVSVPPAQQAEDFSQFVTFLRALQESRGRRAAVSGLPVFLALTKCDLLARPGDTEETWNARVQDAGQEAANRFLEFLQSARASDRPVFGALRVTVRTTAVIRPPLPPDSGDPQKPFGVAALFGDALRQADVFRCGRRRAGWRLLWTLVGTLGLLGVMAALAAAMILGLKHEPSGLEARLAAYRALEGDTAVQRLREPLAPKIDALRAIERDPQFPALPPPDQAYVHSRLQELEAYQRYSSQLAAIRPGKAHSLAELERLDTRLNDALAPPAAYRQDWTGTEADQLRGRLLAEIGRLRQAATDLIRSYQGLVRRSQDLRLLAHSAPGDPASWRDWLDRTRTVRSAHPIPSVKEQSTDARRATVLTYSEVIAAHGDWEVERARLERFAELVAALGLAGPQPGGQEPPLEIPADFQVSQAASVMARMEAQFPRLLMSAAPSEIPEAAIPAVRQAAQIPEQRLIEAGRTALLAELQQLCPDGQETLDRWRALRRWLLSPSSGLEAWRVLATFLARIEHPTAVDPVLALAEFLAKDRFTLRLHILTLRLPAGLGLTPAGPLTVYHQHQSQPLAPLTFRSTEGQNSASAERGTIHYPFVADEVATVNYVPGDSLWAELPVRRATESGDWLLTWSVCRSQMYQFERLTRHPRLHRKEQPNTQGKLIKEAILAVTPATGVPRVPDLMPVVRLTPRPR